jgi:hypothetical protein
MSINGEMKIDNYINWGLIVYANDVPAIVLCLCQNLTFPNSHRAFKATNSFFHSETQLGAIKCKLCAALESLSLSLLLAQPFSQLSLKSIVFTCPLKKEPT